MPPNDSIRVSPAGGSTRIDLPLRIDDRLTIAVDELGWRFSRSSGPGGQGVNTADSRVELTWDPAGSPSVAALPDHLRSRLIAGLSRATVNGRVVIVASEQRAQLRNRELARQRLRLLVLAALAPPSPTRRASRPTRGSVERRLAGKKARSAIKAARSGHQQRRDD
jgi:ribosome-associated protein